MPAAIPLIAGFAASGVVAAAGTFAWVAAAAGGIVAFGTTKILGLDEQPTVPDPGTQVNVKGTIQAIPIIYGQRRIGGVIAQAMTTGKVRTAINAPNGIEIDVADQIDNKYFNMILCWCEGEIEGVQQLYFDDKLSTSSEFTGYTNIGHFVGTDDQPASAVMLSTLANTFDAETAARFWSSAHQLKGIAYTRLKLEYKASVWPTGVPTVTAEIKGRKVLDLRTSTWAWSQNPALIIYDYLTNTRFGRGIDASEIDTQTFIDAANYCDQPILIEVAQLGELGNITVTQARYACDAILNPDDTCLDNLRILLGTCRGALVFSGGKYKLKLDKPEASTFNLTEDNIVGGWNIILESTDSRYNRVHVQWRDPAKKYADDYVILESPTYLAADNNEVLDARIDLPATTNYLRPKQMAGMVLRQSRYSLQCEVTCTIEGLAIEVFDVISVTHELPGWDGELFRVMAISLESDDQVRLQLQQYADEVYDLDSQNDQDSLPPTNLPDPFYVQPVDSIAYVPNYELYPDGTARSWYEVVFGLNNQHVNVVGYRLRWRVSGSASPWFSTDIPPDAGYITPFGDNTRYEYLHELDVVQSDAYDIEISAFNSLGVQSVPATLTLDPIGSSDPPPALSDLDARANDLTEEIYISWTTVSPPDGFPVSVEIWSSQTSSFANASLLYTATVTVSTPVYNHILPGGATTRWYWGRQVNTISVPGTFYPASSGAGVSATLS